MRIRTGYSFKTAVGHLKDVAARIKEVGWDKAPITDRLSTYGHVRWQGEAKKVGLEPVYGVEVGVTASMVDKQLSVDWWTFLAADDLAPLHELIYLATSQPGLAISYSQAAEASRDLIAIAGDTADVDRLPRGIPLLLSPATPRGQVKRAIAAKRRLIAAPANYFPRPDDKEVYRVIMGRGASVQTYPQWIVSDQEYASALSWLDPKVVSKAISERDRLMASCRAELKEAAILVPEKKQSLRAMCVAGAKVKSIDLANPIYKDRLTRELDLIAIKQFEDYFYIIADMVSWAKDKMVVGPARGSSCGSLVCYLLDITAIDPVPYNLLFERFIDITRADLPDIDLDFSDQRREMVFRYAEDKYGRDHVARLGSVSMFGAKSILNEIGKALKIPPWEIEELSNTVIKRSMGDSRAGSTIEDTFKDTQVGVTMLEKYPEVIISTKMEAHPHNAGQHAAGVVITQDPVTSVVAIDGRTGATMCDKKDAEKLGLLKIDALGLTQLGIFERCLDLMAVAGVKGVDKLSRYLEKIPVDDPAAYDILNQARFSGIFQFGPGSASSALVSELATVHGGRIDSMEDIISLTALVRPGPLGSGAANEWLKRRAGRDQVSYFHPQLEPYLKSTLGILVYQEQVMQIAREIGDLTWDDVTALRKAMSRSLGKEYFNQYGDRWKEGARKRGWGDEREKFWDDLCLEENTKIRRTNCKKGEHLTIKQLYRKYESHPSYDDARKGHMPSLLSLFPDGRVRPQRAMRIIKSGKKVCWRYWFDDKSQVTCTPDHRFIINGEWQRIGDARIGDEFAVIASDHETRGIRKLSKTGKGSGSNQKGRKRNGIGLQKLIRQYRNEMIGKSCQDCREVRPWMEVHHNDLVGGRERPHDVAWLCSSCHKKRHGELMGGWTYGHTTATRKLIKTKLVGERNVYDISMPDQPNFVLQNGLIAHNCLFGMWAFNRSHSVSYALVSYWCLWLKAHYPLEFAAATLDSEDDPLKQVVMLKELRNEGISYTPVDPKLSTDHWQVGKKRLIGPLTAIKGIGPAKVKTILDHRATGQPLPPGLEKQLAACKTEIDTLDPISDAIRRECPDLTEKNIFSSPIPIIEAVPKRHRGPIMVMGLIQKISPLNENEPSRINRRNGRVFTGPLEALNFRIRDDSGDDIFCKIDRWKFDRIGREMLESCRAGNSLYAVKGPIPDDFRMIRVDQIRYIGELDGKKRASKKGEAT
jgi:hypothetical protein